MTIKAIIWDVGGVLERTEDPAPRLALAQRLEWKVEPLMDLVFGASDHHRLQLGQISYQEHLQTIAQTLGQPEHEILQTIQDFFAGDRLDFEIVDVIRQLKANYTTAILSNYSTRLREKIYQQWEIADAFDHLIISGEVHVMKPDPEIFNIALNRVGCKPNQAVFIDDVYENIAAARQAGLHAVHFQDRDQALETLYALLQQHGSNT